MHGTNLGLRATPMFLSSFSRVVRSLTGGCVTCMLTVYLFDLLAYSDDEVELSAIRDSIGKCIKHDPANALPAVCDYAVALPETDESYNPDLRSAVVSFMITHLVPPAIEAFNASLSALEPFSKAIVKVCWRHLPGPLDSTTHFLRTFRSFCRPIHLRRSPLWITSSMPLSRGSPTPYSPRL